MTRRLVSFLLLVLVLTFVTACGNSDNTSGETQNENIGESEEEAVNNAEDDRDYNQKVEVEMADPEGENIGRVILNGEESGGVQFEVDLVNIPQGKHKMSIVKSNVCEAPEFKADVEADNKELAADIPEVEAGDNRKVVTEFTVDNLTFDEEGEGKTLLEGNANSLVLYGTSEQDGERIACGVIGGQ
ncbi:hypothetical protein [Pseudalkalibacillus caeni]|nr:hypothetical protein [Pseudalkalibacillus caeni]